MGHNETMEMFEEIANLKQRIATLSTGISRAEQRELEALAEADELRAKVATLSAENERLKKLAAAVHQYDHEKGCSCIACERDSLKAQLAEMSKPVTDEEFDLYFCIRQEINALLASRAGTKQE